MTHIIKSEDQPDYVSPQPPTTQGSFDMTNKDEVFAFLDIIRETGSINMFGAAPSIMKEFDVSKKEAKDLLMQWMEQQPCE